MKAILPVRAALILSVVAGAARADIRYTLTDLGTLGGTMSQPSAINAAGVVTGFSTNADGAQRAFRWSLAAGMQDLPSSPDGIDQTGGAINSAGIIVGR